MFLAIVIFLGACWFFSKMGTASQAEKDAIDPKWLDDPNQYAAWQAGKEATEKNPVTYTVRI